MHITITLLQMDIHMEMACNFFENKSFTDFLNAVMLIHSTDDNKYIFEQSSF